MDVYFPSQLLEILCFHLHRFLRIEKNELFAPIQWIRLECRFYKERDSHLSYLQIQLQGVQTQEILMEWVNKTKETGCAVLGQLNSPIRARRFGQAVQSRLWFDSYNSRVSVCQNIHWTGVCPSVSCGPVVQKPGKMPIPMEPLTSTPAGGAWESGILVSSPVTLDSDGRTTGLNTS